VKPTVGLWIWNEADERPPSPPLEAWRAAGVSRVYLKCGDGSSVWGQFAGEIAMLHGLGFEVYGWQYVYGSGHGDESGPGIKALQDGADGLVLDVEGEWEASPAPASEARTLVGKLRAASSRPILMTSFGQPNYHARLAWPTWSQLVDGFLPEVFPEEWNSTIAGSLDLMYRSHQNVGVTKPLYPVAYLYPADNPVVKPEDVTEFLGQAEAGGYEHVSFWRDGIMDQACVDAIAAYLGTGGWGETVEDRLLRIEAFLGETFKSWS
jgi:hypothetical protein